MSSVSGRTSVRGFWRSANDSRVVEDDDGVRLAQPKQLRGEQAYDLGCAAPRCVLVQEARAMLAIVGPRVLLLSDRLKLSP